MKILITIIILGVLILGFFFIPIGTWMIPDSEIYGDYFCYTYDGSCISTAGHYTSDELTLFKYIKLKDKIHKLE